MRGFAGTACLCAWLGPFSEELNRRPWTDTFTQGSETHARVSLAMDVPETAGLHLQSLIQLSQQDQLGASAVKLSLSNKLCKTQLYQIANLTKIFLWGDPWGSSQLLGPVRRVPKPGSGTGAPSTALAFLAL